MELKEITRLAVQIEKLHQAGNYEDISGLLTDIYDLHVTLEQLQTTDIAKSVYRLVKSCPVASVRKRGKDVLSKWKCLYGSRHGQVKRDNVDASIEDRGQKVNDEETIVCFNVGRESCDVSCALEAKTQAETCSSLPPEENPRTHSTLPPLKTSSVNSTLRNKCVELLIRALNQDLTHSELTTQLAHAVEAHVDALHGHNTSKYKSCIRSKVANLKDPKNPRLRRGLLSGMLAPEVFARMSAQEMAGDELRRLRQVYTAAGISDHQLPQGPEGTATTKVRCQRCEAMDCRVTHISRGTLFLPSWVKRGSADEEAMTFMTCAKCGAQWYHNRWVCL